MNPLNMFFFLLKTNYLSNTTHSFQYTSKPSPSFMFFCICPVSYRIPVLTHSIPPTTKDSSHRGKTFFMQVSLDLS